MHSDYLEGVVNCCLFFYKEEGELIDDLDMECVVDEQDVICKYKIATPNIPVYVDDSGIAESYTRDDDFVQDIFSAKGMDLKQFINQFREFVAIKTEKYLLNREKYLR